MRFFRKQKCQLFIKKKAKPISICFVFVVLFYVSSISFAQVNFVPNPGFEDISDCDIEYGDADKALPWRIVDEEVASPDLYHACSSSPFYDLPSSGCFPVYPNSGDGMVGLVNLVAEERIYVGLTEELPSDVDIYVAYSIIPQEKCGSPMEMICYSNTQSLAFSDYQFQMQEVVLELENVLDVTEEWTTLESCYQATGEEKLVLIGNYKLTSQTLRDCDYIDPMGNFAYFYVDDVIVSPFDIVPDTMFICGEEVLNIDATFYDVPISWSDGVEGALRAISEGGVYTVMGEVGDCFLNDTTIVIEIPDETETINLAICKEEELQINSPVLTLWPNGDTSRSMIVTAPGNFTAELLTTCGERSREYIVEEKSCTIDYFVPNIFSPNDDGINDQLEFFFQSEFEYLGKLTIYNRWGNLIFQIDNVSSSELMNWDGTFKGKALNQGVFVWSFQYVSSKDGVGRVIYGDVTLVK